MEVDLDGKRTLLHALLENDRMGISRADILRFLFQLRRRYVHGDDPARLDLLRDEFLRRMSAIVLIEKEKIDGRPLEGIAIQVSFTLNNGRITHMEKTRASQFDDEGLAN
jgi:hypothetical protein